ncbi:hypothetical protein K7X08_014973 [Anisodus acutangulus]|uniref:Uncharacterized protein n=1 Tax=Anisodus acutangulus TaxID=402998 RepID=A0A9Q1QV32_9SOLA|nr:hypothetical protein K7X08_014973 [Anisodus acutangulus]
MPQFEGLGSIVRSTRQWFALIEGVGTVGLLSMGFRTIAKFPVAGTAGNLIPNAYFVSSLGHRTMSILLLGPLNSISLRLSRVIASDLRTFMEVIMASSSLLMHLRAFIVGSPKAKPSMGLW